MNKWYKAGAIAGWIVMQAIYVYIIIDGFNNVIDGKSIVPNLTALFAIAAWKNVMRLAEKCKEKPLDLNKIQNSTTRFYRLKGE